MALDEGTKRGLWVALIFLILLIILIAVGQADKGKVPANPTVPLPPAGSGPIAYIAPMSGAQVVPTPAQPSTATGTASLTVATVSTAGTVTAQYSVTAQGLSSNIQAIGIYSGAPGVTGPLVKNIPLIPGINTDQRSGTWTGTWSNTDNPAFVFSNLTAGAYYIQISTVNRPASSGGEIRGNFIPQPVT